MIRKAVTRKSSGLLFIAVWALALFDAPLSARPSKDTLLFKNGDRWTCEIKKLDHGYLYVGLDYVDGTVQVDWNKIARIESPQLFVVIDEQGIVSVGPLSTSNTGPDQVPVLTLRTDQSVTTIRKSEVTTIQQTETSFWHNFHGGVSAGSNVTKSNNQSQFSFNANVDYLKERWSASTQLQGSFNGSVSAPSNLRRDLTTSAMRLLNRRNYFVIAVSDFLRSDEQQLALRATLGGGLGKLLLNGERSRFYVLGGAVWAREHYTTTTPPYFNSAEGLLGAKLEYFRFKTTNCYISTNIYPSMSDPGRIRFDGNTGVKYEIIKDLYLNFSFYVNYDSRPPRATTKSDYGGSSSLGWTF
jgi:putative salt-induced outer membrane protein YdiY